MSNEVGGDAARRCCRNCRSDAPAVHIRVDDPAIVMFVCRNCLPQAMKNIGVELQPRIIDDIQLSVSVNPLRVRYDL
jgi:hypothetical protein